jgi:hypothetical protein
LNGDVGLKWLIAIRSLTRVGLRTLRATSKRVEFQLKKLSRSTNMNSRINFRKTRNIGECNT